MQAFPYVLFHLQVSSTNKMEPTWFLWLFISKKKTSIFDCMVILQSRGQAPDSCWKYGTDLSRSSSSFLDLAPGFENIHTFKCWSGIFPTILTYTIMLENCQNNISVYGCSPIQGTTFYSCWNLMKPGSQSRTYMPASLPQQWAWPCWGDPGPGTSGCWHMVALPNSSTQYS